MSSQDSSSEASSLSGSESDSYGPAPLLYNPQPSSRSTSTTYTEEYTSYPYESGERSTGSSTDDDSVEGEGRGPVLSSPRGDLQQPDELAMATTQQSGAQGNFDDDWWPYSGTRRSPGRIASPIPPLTRGAFTSTSLSLSHHPFPPTDARTTRPGGQQKRDRSTDSSGSDTRRHQRQDAKKPRLGIEKRYFLPSTNDINIHRPRPTASRPPLPYPVGLENVQPPTVLGSSSVPTPVLTEETLRALRLPSLCKIDDCVHDFATDRDTKASTDHIRDHYAPMVKRKRMDTKGTWTCRRAGCDHKHPLTLTKMVNHTQKMHVSTQYRCPTGGLCATDVFNSVEALQAHLKACHANGLSSVGRASGSQGAGYIPQGAYGALPPQMPTRDKGKGRALPVMDEYDADSE